MNSNKNAVILARTQGGEAMIKAQVHALKRYADQNGISVVATVTLPHCSANDFNVQENLTALLGRRHGCPDFKMIVVTDLTRLSRRGIPEAMNFIKKLAAAGISVVTPDLGVVNERLWASFPRRRRGWARHKNSDSIKFSLKKVREPNASNERSAARDEDTEAVTRESHRSRAAADTTGAKTF